MPRPLGVLAMLVLLRVILVEGEVPLVRAMVLQEAMEALNELLVRALARLHGVLVGFYC